MDYLSIYQVFKCLDLLMRELEILLVEVKTVMYLFVDKNG
jgi:hypothetical protein